MNDTVRAAEQLRAALMRFVPLVDDADDSRQWAVPSLDALDALLAALAASEQARQDAEARQLESDKVAIRQNERANRAEADLAAARQVWEDDAALMAGYFAVQKMLMLRVGDQAAHADAFRRAALASLPEEQK